MDIKEVQKSSDSIAQRMLEKGFRQPHVDLSINSNSQPSAYLRWDKIDGRPYETESHFERENTIQEVINAAFEWVANQPTIEQRQFREFAEILGKAIEIGKQNGIEATLVNPLEAAMKKLSKNALMYAPEAERT